MFVNCPVSDIQKRIDAWNWGEVKLFGQSYPLFLAGSLRHDTIAHAVFEASTDAVDISSGVELSPGRKDIHEVSTLIRAISLCTLKRQPRKIWRPAG